MPLDPGPHPGRTTEVRISRRGVRRAADLGLDLHVFQDRPTRYRGPGSRQRMSGIPTECIEGCGVESLNP